MTREDFVCGDQFLSHINRWYKWCRDRKRTAHFPCGYGENQSYHLVAGDIRKFSGAWLSGMKNGRLDIETINKKISSLGRTGDLFVFYAPFHWSVILRSDCSISFSSSPCTSFMRIRSLMTFRFASRSCLFFRSSRRL